MEIETVEDLATWLADKFGIYGGCKSDGETGCEFSESKPFCCRQGFMEAIKERIKQAVKNDEMLQKAEGGEG